MGNALFIATSLAVIVGLGQRRLRGRDRAVRDGAGRGHRGRPAAGRHAGRGQLAGPVLRGLGPDGHRADRHRGAGRAYAEARPPHRPVRAAARPAPPRPADHVADRALLQLGLLHRPGVRAVPDEPEPDQARPGLHRLGHPGGPVRRVRRAAPAGKPGHRQDHVPQPGRVRRDRAGHRHLDDRPRGADPGRDRVRDLHRGQQHDHHPGRDDRLPGGEAGRLGGVQLRQVHRRRPGPLRGPAGHRGQHPLPVLHRRRGHPARHRRPVHRAPPAQRGRAGPGRAGPGGRCGAGQYGARPGTGAGGRAAGTTDRSAQSIVAAVDGSPIAALVTEAAARLAAADGRAVHVVHVQEDVTAGDAGADGEDLAAARAAVRRQLDLLAAHHVPAEGQILLHAPDHGTAGRMIAEYAAAIGAGTIVIGASSHGGLPALMDASASRELGRHANSNILIVNPDAPGTLIAADEWSELEASRPR